MSSVDPGIETSSTPKEALPTIHDRMVNLYERRAAGSPLVHLGNGYGPTEFARDGGFRRPYVGKEYIDATGRHQTEVLPMGLQWLFEDPATFAKIDPDHFNTIIEALHGIPETNAGTGEN